jgi:hypothetical protein
VGSSSAPERDAVFLMWVADEREWTENTSHGHWEADLGSKLL